MKKFTKGFTLIELLVVIAVIGILSSIVLVSLSGARDKARDARIQADLGQIRSTAELFYDDNDYNYSGLCSDEDVNALKADIEGQNTSASYACFASGDEFCVSANLVSSGAGTVCVSDAGVIGDDTCAAADTTCD